MRLLKLISLLVLSWPVFCEVGLSLLPEGRLMRLSIADPREIRMALRFEGDNRVDASIGNYFSLFGIEPKDKDAKWKLVSGIEGAGYFTMHEADRRFPLESADGLIGFYTEGQYDILQWQVRYTHISAHLADGSSGSPIAYSREAIRLRAGAVPVPELNVYAGVQWLMHSVPELSPWTWQLGFSYFLPWSASAIVPFVASDYQFRRETGSDYLWNIQLGVGINNPPYVYRSFRFYYNYNTGFDPRGQFFRRNYSSHAFSIEMQI